MGPRRAGTSVAAAWLAVVLAALAGCEDRRMPAKPQLGIAVANAAQADSAVSQSDAQSPPTALPLGDKVKAALSADERLRHSAIAVKAAQGVVTLYGTVDTSANRDRAARIAYTVEGTRYVKSNLLVTSGRWDR